MTAHDDPASETFDVFLSHATGDSDAVCDLYRLLETQGVRAWIDRFHLPAGEGLDDNIKAGIGASRTFAVVMGPNYRNERYRSSEVHWARERSRPILVVLLPGGLPGNVPGSVGVGNHHWLTIDSSDGPRGSGLLKLLRRLLSTRGLQMLCQHIAEEVMGQPPWRDAIITDGRDDKYGDESSVIRAVVSRHLRDRTFGALIADLKRRYPQDRQRLDDALDPLRYLDDGLLINVTAPDPIVVDVLAKRITTFIDAIPVRPIGGAELPRDETDALVHAIVDGPGPIWVDGEPGAGKSTVVRQALVRLRDRGVPVLPIRLDREPDDPRYSSPEQLQLPCHPIDALDRAAAGDDGPVVLLLDQLDATNEMSGDRGEVWPLIERLVAGAVARPNVRLVFVCRTVELRDDKRLADLLREHPGQNIQVSRLSEKVVCQVLDRLGIVYPRDDAEVLNLLRLPVYLGLAADVVPAGQRLGLLTAASLIDRYLRLCLDKAVAPGLSEAAAIQALTALVDRMVTGQRLDVQVGPLETHRGAWYALASTGLLLRTGDRVAFLHQALFDRVWVVTTPALANGVGAWLSGLGRGGQDLFHRPLVKHALLRERMSNPGLWAADLHALAHDSGIRDHMRAVLVRVLREVPEADADAWEVIRPMLTDPDPYLRDIAWNVVWNHRVWWSDVRREMPSLLRHPDLGARACGLLGACSEFDQAGVGHLIAGLVSDGSEVARKRVVEVFVGWRWSPDQAAVDALKIALDRGWLDGGDPARLRAALSGVGYRVSGPVSVRWLSILVRRLLQIDGSDSALRRSDDGGLAARADKWPDEVLRWFLPMVSDEVSRGVADHPGEGTADRFTSVYARSRHPDLGESIVRALAKAIVSAASSPERPGWVGKLRDRHSATLRRLEACWWEARLKHHPSEAPEVHAFLVDIGAVALNVDTRRISELVMSVDDVEVERVAVGRGLRPATGLLALMGRLAAASSELAADLEARVLLERPRPPRWGGHDDHRHIQRVLRALGPQSEEGRRRLGELDRALPPDERRVPTPTLSPRPETEWSGWLEAHVPDDLDTSDGWSEVHEFTKATAKEPERLIPLADRLRGARGHRARVGLLQYLKRDQLASTHVAQLDAWLEGMPDEVLQRPRVAGQAAHWMADGACVAWSPALLARMASLAVGLPDDPHWSRSTNLDDASVNEPKAILFRALAAVIREQPSRWPEISGAVERSLDDVSEGVRAAATWCQLERIRGRKGPMPDDLIAWSDRLFAEGSERLLGADSVYWLLRRNADERWMEVVPVLRRLVAPAVLVSGDPPADPDEWPTEPAPPPHNNGPEIGAILATLATLPAEGPRPGSVELVEFALLGPPATRKGVAMVVSANLAVAMLRPCGKQWLSWLETCLADAGEGVSAAAVDLFQQAEPADLDQLEPAFDMLLRSPAFPRASYDLTRLLLKDPQPRLTWLASWLDALRDQPSIGQTLSPWEGDALTLLHRAIRQSSQADRYTWLDRVDLLFRHHLRSGEMLADREPPRRATTGD